MSIVDPNAELRKRSIIIIEFLTRNIELMEHSNAPHAPVAIEHMMVCRRIEENKLERLPNPIVSVR